MAVDPQRVEAVFLAAVDAADPDAREAILQRECAADSELRGRVETLLAAHDDPNSFLDRPAVGPANSPQLDETSDSPNSAVDGATNVTTSPVGTPGASVAGRYRLIELIGEGGMGTVWMAEQREPVKRLVALKLIKPGMASKTVLARFEAERQALALMDHPNIAKVLDGGTTADGHPYFVMELVRGIPLTTYCDTNRLAIPERLNLFVQTCQAVQHAHQKGIIHRDIKPTNILVTEHDDRPVPKVIDFGLAKALQGPQALTDHTLFTAFGAMVGTPLYMAPEQTGINALDVDTRSDVYALGVILYELLTGSTPLERQRFKEAALDEVYRMIREEDPPKPSTRLSSSEALPSIAACRHTEPTKLARLLSGELDWIVLKSLEKDRTRRYETANSLAIDIQRFLANEPVSAGPPSNLYRFQKMVQRNKLTFVAASAVAAALVVGTIVSIYFAVQANRQADDARQSADLAKAAGDRERGEHQNAVRQQKVAEQERDAAGRNLYLANLNLAGQAWEAAETTRLQELLARQVPQAGRRDYRGWEWHYLDVQSRGLVSLRGHTSTISCLAWSPDGKRVASGAAQSSLDSGELKLWDVATGRELFALGGDTKYGIQAVAWSPDGKRLAAGGGRLAGFQNSLPGELKIWDATNGQDVLTLRGHMGHVNAVAWSPDGLRLASASGEFNPPGEVKIWDAVTGNKLFDLVGHTNQANSVSWSPDGKQLASTCADGTIKVWNTATGQVVHTLHGHTKAVYTALWSPDGMKLASTSADPAVKIWDAATGKDLQTLSIPPGVALTWNPDGKSIEHISNEGIITTWDLATSQVSNTIKLNSQPSDVAVWSPDRQRLGLASSDGSIKIVDIHSVSEAIVLHGGAAPVESVAWTPDGQRLATTGADIKIWNAATGRQVQTLPWPEGWVVIAAAWSPDGQRLVSSSLKKFSGTIKVWDTSTAAELFMWNAHIGPAFGVAWSPDGRQLATGGADNLIRIWDAHSRDKELAKLVGHTGYVWSVAWHPEQQRLASASEDGTVRIWNLKHPQEPLVLRGHGGEVRSVTWSPDGQWLASGGMDGIKVWDAVSGKVRLTLRGHSGPVTCVAWRAHADPDRQRLASIGDDGMLKIWDLITGQEVLTLHGNKSPLRSVAWSPDGQRLVAGSADGTIKLWDAGSRAVKDAGITEANTDLRRSNPK